MAHAFDDEKGRYEFVEGRAVTTSGVSNSFFESYTMPWMFKAEKTQMRAHLDTMQIRISIQSLPTTGTIGKVATKYRPGIPALLTIVRDTAPYKPVGTAFIGMDGTFSFYTESAGDVQIYGTYTVADHD